MKLTKAELTEELESKKKILGYVRQRKRILEEQYALEGLQARPNIRIEIEDTEENIAVREVEIDNLEKLLAEFDNPSGKGTSPLSPKELTYNLHERYIRLSIGQKRILALIERQPFDNSVVSQAELENNFKEYTGGEIYYRLEQLYLLGFIEKQQSYRTEQGVYKFIYSISSAYRKIRE